MTDPTTLMILWFVLEAVLWIGFFFLEGFDFGVAMLYPFLGKNPRERRVMINTIGPVWDGNEVWLLTAGGAMFAAFPGWYSTMFSGLYLPLFLVLFGLIIRGISFEYRALNPSTKWRDAFDWCATIGSFIVTLVFGVAFANLWMGVPVQGEPPLVAAGFWELFRPFALLGGLTLVVLFTVHGAIYLALKTTGVVYDNAISYIRKVGPVAVLLLTAFVIGGNLFYPASDNPWLGGAAGPVMWILGIASVIALTAAILGSIKNKNTPAFIGGGLSIALIFASIFVKIYGTLGFIAVDAATKFDMTVAASSEKTLGIMSIAALIFVPIVLAYQAWSFWVFRKRISVDNMPPEPAASPTGERSTEGAVA